MQFEDRTDAGRRLGARLAGTVGRDVVVLGVPRGGVPVAREAARALGAPLDVLVVAPPGRAEARELGYRQGMTPEPLRGRTAVVVDEGATTGRTAAEACRIARSKGAARVVLGLPVAKAAALEAVRGECDDLVCLHSPRPFWTVGLWYADFDPVPDRVVRALLRAARGLAPLPAPPDGEPGIRQEDVVLHWADSAHCGRLALPPRPTGLVVRGVRRSDGGHSAFGRRLEADLAGAGLATLRVDLLPEGGAADVRSSRNLPVLARGLTAAAGWARARPDLGGIPVGYCGGGTAGAAALVASTLAGAEAGAVVTYSARVDVVRPWLPQVTVPTLFIVGERDDALREMHRGAQSMLAGPNRLELVPGARIAEAGAADGICRLASRFFAEHLAVAAGAPRPAI